MPGKNGGTLLVGGDGKSGGRPKAVVRSAFIAVAESGAQYCKDVVAGKVKGATIADKLRAIDVAGKYGLGTQQEIDGAMEVRKVEVVMRREDKSA